MKITIRYMAALRDRMGQSECVLDLPDTITDSAALTAHLRAADPAAEALEHPSIRLIRNDEIVAKPVALETGDTLAFCPPFTGG
ncbi:MoaD/ThiS family protein [Maricaulis parjimensis]|uniref:MoaD/ThiS family protein n=1 Tax=Maricaulis parjimensis TaxID=144023 RepID=UPI001939FBF2|nr:MoaD/ThiS family protein [Maricaulis parjimensis]